MKSFIIIYICIMTMVNNNIGNIYKPETITEVTTETITKNNNKNLEDEVLNISDNENIYNNNVLSGDGFFIDKSEYNIYNHLYYTLYGQESPDFGIAFIKPDNSLWLAGKDSDMVSSKLMDNVASIAASFTYYPNHIEILKTDGSVWGFSVSYSYTSDKWEFNDASKVTDNVKQIKAGYVIKNDNSLWSTLTEEEKIMDDVLYLTIGGYTPVSNRLYDRNQYFVLIKTDGSLWQGHEVREMNKIADDVLYVRSSTLSTKENYNLDHYTAIIKTDNSLWAGKDDNLNDLKKISDNIIAVDVHNNKIVSVNTNNDLILYDCSKENVSSIKLADNVKYAKINSISNIYILKTDNSLWVKHRNKDTPKKLLDNIISILGNSNLFFIDKDQNLIEISNTEEVCTEYIDLNSK